MTVRRTVLLPKLLRLPAMRRVPFPATAQAPMLDASLARGVHGSRELTNREAASARLSRSDFSHAPHVPTR